MESGRFFASFNVTPPASRRATITAAKSGSTFPTTLVHVRAGEMTFAVVTEEPL